MRINALYADQKARHVQLVTDPRYENLFCTLHPDCEVLNSPATRFIRGSVRHQREFIYNIGRRNFDLEIHADCIKTPYHVRIRHPTIVRAREFLADEIERGDGIEHVSNNSVGYEATAENVISEITDKAEKMIVHDEIEHVYKHHVITLDDAALFMGYPSPYSWDGLCQFSDEEEGIRVFTDYLAHVSAHFLRLLAEV